MHEHLLSVEPYTVDTPSLFLTVVVQGPGRVGLAVAALTWSCWTTRAGWLRCAL